MNAMAIVDRLARFAAVFPGAAGVASEEDARWKPRPEDWSILEICCHMLDEEREDFRVRLTSTLSDPARAWPDLNLEGIAEKRGYNARDLKETLAAWVEERRVSVKWLREWMREHPVEADGAEVGHGQDARATAGHGQDARATAGHGRDARATGGMGQAYEHPKWGAIHAGDLLASWAAHDALHLRQVAKRLHQLAARDAGRFKVEYAGEWKA